MAAETETEKERTPLEKQHDRTVATYEAAKAICKWLGKLPREDQIMALQHVAIEMKLGVTVTGQK